MTEQHPITPPPELVAQWYLGARAMPVDQWVTDVATQAARWGADQELEACCEWFIRDWTDIETADTLRAARRPKPPSLKEQALNLIQKPKGSTPEQWLCLRLEEVETVRRALEQLND